MWKLLAAMGGLIAAGPSLAEQWSPPAANARCPSKWGAADRKGNVNLITPASVASAAKLIKKGEIIELGRVLDGNLPGRHFHTTFNIPSDRGRTHAVGNDEFVATSLGQVGTQFDAFAHAALGDNLYNCVSNKANWTRDNGALEMAVDGVGTLFTRGVMIDVAAYKGVVRLAPGYEITVADLEGALKRQKSHLEPGDAVLINTGHGALYGKDNDAYMKSWPGIGIPAAEWLVTKQPAIVGADNPPIEVFPMSDPTLWAPVHSILIAINGIHLVENLKLDEMAANKVYEFAFVLQPLKIKGGSGSTVAPSAIR